MNDNYYNLSPEEKRKQDDDMYQKFIMLGIIPLFIYLMWPFIFGTRNAELQAEVVEERIEKIDKNIEKQFQVGETTSIREERTAPVVAPAKRPNNVKKVQPGTIKKSRTTPSTTFALTHNPGDKIEYIVQNAGWRGVVQGKQNGNYTVKLTEILTANAQQQYLPGNNPCFGGKPIGKNAVNQVIVVAGRCIHAPK